MSREIKITDEMLDLLWEFAIGDHVTPEPPGQQGRFTDADRDRRKPRDPQSRRPAA